MSLPEGIGMESVERVLKWQDSPMGPCKKVVSLGWADNPLNEIIHTLPDAPQRKEDYLYHDHPQEDYLSGQQYWRRDTLPKFWSFAYIQKVAKANHDGDLLWWWHSPTKEMKAYWDREKKRREEGVWMMIQGKPEYITGHHYMFIQWTYLREVGRYSDYRDVSRIRFYAYQAAIEDPYHFGLIYLKHRRGGASSECLSCLLDYITSHKNANAGIQSMSAKHAKETLFQEKLVPMWQNYPVFFRPDNDGTTNPKNELIFAPQARRGASKWEDHAFDGDDAEDGEGYHLNSTIRVAGTNPSGGSMLDAKNLKRVHYDEAGKASKENPVVAWGTIRPTLTHDGRVGGKAFFPSTVEEMRGQSHGLFKMLWDNAMPCLAKESGIGRTPNGLLAFFIPAYIGFCDEYTFIGKYGENVIDKPEGGQLEWLCANYPDRADTYRQHGSHSFVTALRKAVEHDSNALAAEYRKYPLTPDEAFISSTGASKIDPIVCAQVLAALNARTSRGTFAHQELITKMRLEWGPNGEVRGFPDRDGPWEIAASFIGEMNSERAKKLGYGFNKCERRPSRPGRYDPHGVLRPHQSKFVIGVDPIDSDKNHATSPYGLSDFCAHVFWPFDLEYDKEAMQHEGWHHRIKSHGWVARYRDRPPRREMAYEECIKMAVWINAKIHAERTRGSDFSSHIDSMGLVGFKSKRPACTFFNGNPQDEIWTPTTDLTHEMGSRMLNEWVVTYGCPEKCPFPAIWKDWSELDLAQVGKYDDFAASEFSIFAGGGKSIDAPREKSDIAGRGRSNAPASYILYRT